MFIVTNMNSSQIISKSDKIDLAETVAKKMAYETKENYMILECKPVGIMGMQLVRSFDPDGEMEDLDLPKVNRRPNRAGRQGVSFEKRNEVRALYGTMTQREIAKKVGIGYSTVGKILRT